MALKKTPTATKKLDNVIAMTTLKEFIAKNVALDTTCIHTANVSVPFYFLNFLLQSKLNCESIISNETKNVTCN